jgi:predicted nucleic acid-binding Zn ribbon protein
MVKTWKTGERSPYECNQCGSKYETYIWRAPTTDSDSAHCEVCGNHFKSWNSTNTHMFDLIERADWEETK